MTQAPAVFGEASRPCSSCGRPVDPLRAERVAFVRDRFRYFCSADCRERYDHDVLATPLPVPKARGATPLPPAPVSEARASPPPAPVQEAARAGSGRRARAVRR